MYLLAILHRLTEKEECEINSFLQQFNEFLYFQSPAFFRVCSSSEKIRPAYIIARDGEQLIGVLLYYQQVQTTVNLLRFFTSRNVIIAGPVVKENKGVVFQNLLQIYKDKGAKSIYTQIRNLDDVSMYKSDIETYNFAYEDHLTIIIDLTQTEEEIWKGIHTKRRNEIRRAEKEGCQVELQTSLTALLACYDILKEVYQRAQLPLPPIGYFKALLEQTDDTTGLRMFTAIWGGQIIGCMLCLAYGNTLYDYYAGSYSRFYHKYPNDLIPWEVFKWGKRNGFTRFDFGGAGKPDVPYRVRNYKQKFGGQLVNYGRYENTEYATLYKMVRFAFSLRQRVMKAII